MIFIVCMLARLEDPYIVTDVPLTLLLSSKCTVGRLGLLQAVYIARKRMGDVQLMWCPVYLYPPG